ncbi:TapB family protein [Tellurirhabdus bombi]|uniref:TapB family protein n=1 Tax=Tellurirhabdus bombi TaxID=2907205 RepID=UPI001F35963C|nr:hypothetical protein [Tellurirhabdus bombi]
MKKLIFFFLLVLSIKTQAQECAGMNLKSGTGYEVLSYNAKGKPNGRLVYKFKDVRKEAGATVVEIGMQSFDEKDKGGTEMLIKYVCNGNEIIADLSGMTQMANQNMRDMELRMKTNAIIYPHNLSPGLKLPDGKLEADMYSKETKMMEISMSFVNRQVEGKESLTVPAGTYTAYKVNSDMNMDNRAMGIPIRSNMKVVSYRSNDVLFDLKSETYRNGKLIGYTVLNKIL